MKVLDIEGCQGDFGDINQNNNTGGDYLLLVGKKVPLEKLNLASCQYIVTCTYFEYLRNEILECNCLVHLDVSWCREVNDTFLNLVSLSRSALTCDNIEPPANEEDSQVVHFPNLQTLNLSGTNITSKGLQCFLKIQNKEKVLKWVDLTSCRAVKRGCKRRHFNVDWLCRKLE